MPIKFFGASRKAHSAAARGKLISTLNEGESMEPMTLQAAGARTISVQYEVDDARRIIYKFRPQDRDRVSSLKVIEVEAEEGSYYYTRSPNDNSQRLRSGPGFDRCGDENNRFIRHNNLKSAIKAYNELYVRQNLFNLFVVAVAGGLNLSMFLVVIYMMVSGSCESDVGGNNNNVDGGQPSPMYNNTFN